MTLVRQAGGVAVGGRALLIEGPSGSGKSNLALQLIDRGAVLIGDDGVTLMRRGDRIFASQPPKTAGLLEVRNLGLLQFPTVGDVPVSLVLRLDAGAPRYIERAELLEIDGVALPLVRVFADCPAIKAELALRLYGLGT